MAELKPCPFCGGKAERIVYPLPKCSHYYAVRAYCLKCGCEINFRYSMSEKIEDPEREAKRFIATKWNRRVDNE